MVRSEDAADLHRSGAIYPVWKKCSKARKSFRATLRSGMCSPREGSKHGDVLRGLGGTPKSEECLIWVTGGWES